MIKPIKINALNTTKFTYSECKQCGFNVQIYWENKIINTDKKIDLENMLLEPCPKCGKNLGDRTDFMIILREKTQTALSICNFLLKDVPSTSNKGLINEYKMIFEDYLNNENLEILDQINGVYYRPSLEGSATDFTTVTKVNFNNQYLSLDDLIGDIQHIIRIIEQI